MKFSIIFVSGTLVLGVAFYAGTQLTRPNVEVHQTNGSEQISEDPEPNIRSELKEDGTRILWTSLDDDSRIVKYVFSSDGFLIVKNEVWFDPNNNPIRSRLTEGAETKILNFKY